MINRLTDNKNKLYFYLFLPMMLFSIVLALWFYQFDLNTRLNETKTANESHVELELRSIELTFKQIFSDLNFLVKQQALRDYLEHSAEPKREVLAKDYLSFSQQKKIYDQIRFLDESGLERVRVNYNHGNVHIVSQNKLQNKAKRYYFKDAYKLSQGKVFVSPFDLNIEQGQIEEPIKPMIRFGMPVFDHKGKKRGIVLLNYLGQDFISRFREIAKGLSGAVMLINRDGYSLSSGQSENDWLFMYPDKQNKAFSYQHKDLWDKLLANDKGQFQQQGKLITYGTVSPLSTTFFANTRSISTATINPNQTNTTNSSYFWKVVSIIDRSDPSFFSKNTWIALISFVLIISIVSLLGTWALTRSRQKLATSALKLETKVGELEKTRDQLIQSEKMASLGRMVAGFAHEVNTPIGIAVGASSQIDSTLLTLEQLLQQDEVEEEDLLQEMQTLQESTRLTLTNLNRAANLVSSFKRSSVDQTSNQIRHYLPYEMANDVINALKNKLKRTQIKIKVHCSESLKIKGQPGLVDQLLTNLILNSYIHAFANGTLAGQIDISINLDTKNAQGEQLHLHYQDNGAGMSSAIREKIFEPFFTTDRVSGTGLGLYLCYNIVTAELKGQIDCQSKLDVGTTFDMMIPINKNDD